MGPGTIDGSVTYSSPTTGIFNGAVADNAGTPSTLTLNSSGGSLTLTGVNTYTGGTAISAGTLYVDGSLSSSASVSNVVTVQSGGTLAGLGTVGGSVTVQSGGAVTAGHSGTGPLTVGSMTFGVSPGDTGTLNVSNLVSDVTVANTAAYLSTTNLVASGGAGSVTVNISGTTLNSNTDYIVATYTSSLLPNGASDPFQLGSLAGLSGRESAELLNVAGTGSISGGGNGISSGTNALELQVTGDAPKWTGAATSSSFGPGAWIPPSAGTIGSPYNWVLEIAGTGTEFRDGDQVLFDDTASSTTVNISNGNVDPIAAVFDNNSTNYVLNGTNGIVDYAGSHTTLTLNGSGMVTINNANTFTGGVFLNNGVLQLGNANAIGNSTNVVTFDPASAATSQLQLDGQIVTIAGLATSAGAAGTSIVANASATAARIANRGRHRHLRRRFAGQCFRRQRQPGSVLVVSGSGTVLTLTGANTYSGGTTINSGATLQIGNGGSTGSITGTVSNSGTLQFNFSSTSTFSGTVTGGTLVQAGSGTLVATGNLNPSSVTINNGDTLQIGSSASLGSLSNAATITNNGTLAFAEPSSSTYTYSGSLASGSLAQAGPGTLVLTGSKLIQWRRAVDGRHAGHWQRLGTGQRHADHWRVAVRACRPTAARSRSATPWRSTTTSR